MLNLKFVEEQPKWRVAVVAYVAKIMGICIHVEGIPFGSARTRRKRAQTDEEMGAEPSTQGAILKAKQ
jgi:hypothetical protein